MHSPTLTPRYKAIVVAIFIVFMLLHQADRLLIGQVLEDVQRDFDIDDAAAGALGTGALVVAAICYPIWGYLYDRFARAKLLALASLIWGVTTALGAVVTTFPAFMAARGATGVDDSSYPGLFSLISDYFGPRVRGRINGLLQVTAPIGFVLSLVLVLVLRDAIGWRNIFLLTGTLGVILAVVIWFGVREVPRGSSEPELQSVDADDLPTFKFEWAAVRALLRRRAILPLFLQGFFGVFPLNVIAFWFFTYLGRERGYDETAVFAILTAAIVSMSVGTIISGAIGDRLFQRTPRGRLWMSFIGVLVGAVLLLVTLAMPPETSPFAFGLILTVTAFFTLFSGPNIIATVYDITLPEVRSTALAIQYFIENIGAASAPLLVGSLSTGMGLGAAIALVSVSTLLITALFVLWALAVVPPDIAALRHEMAERAQRIEASTATTAGAVD